MQLLDLLANESDNLKEMKWRTQSENVKRNQDPWFSLWMFLILAALMMVMAANDWMLTNMVGALAFAMVVGTLLGWVGDHIPVWKTWFGGGMLFACLVAGAF